MAGDGQSRPAAMRKRPAAKGRLRRAVVLVALMVGAAGCVVLATLATVAVHGNHALVRHSLRSEIQRALNQRFRGRWQLGQVGRVSLSQVPVAKIQLLDSHGSVVLQLEELVLQPIPLTQLAQGIEDMNLLRLGELGIQRAHILLRKHKGQLTLLSALQKRPPLVPPRLPPKVKPKRLGVRLEALRVKSLRIQADSTVLEQEVDATVSDLWLSFQDSSKKTSLRVHRLRLQSESLRGGPLETAVEFAFERARKTKRARALARIRGRYYGQPFSLSGVLDGPRLQARFECDRLPEQLVRAWLPDKPRNEALAVQLTLSGTLPQLEARGRIRQVGRGTGPGGTLDVFVQTRVDRTTQFGLRMESRKFDLSRLSKKAPPSRLDAALSSRVRWVKSGAPHAGGLFEIRGGHVAGRHVPRVAGRFEGSPEAMWTWLHAREAGLSADAKLEVRDLKATGKSPSLAFAAAVVVPALERVRRLSMLPGLKGLRGVAGLSATGTLSKRELHATAAVQARGVRHEETGISLGHGRVIASLRGPWKQLQLQLQGGGGRLKLGERELDTVHVNVRGPLVRPRIQASAEGSDGSSLELGTWLAPRRGELQQLQVNWRLGLDSMVGTIARLGPRERRVDGVNLRLFGGTLKGDMRLVAGQPRGSLQATGIGLRQLGRSWLNNPLLRGRLNATLHVPDRPRPGNLAHVYVAVEKLAYVNADLARATGSLRISFDGKALIPTGNVNVSAGVCKSPMAQILVEGSGLELSGGPGAMDQLKRAFGEVVVRARLTQPECVLSPLRKLLGNRVPQIGGHTALRLALRRAKGALWPELDVRMRTSRFRAYVARVAAQPLRSDALDLAINGHWAASGAAKIYAALVPTQPEVNFKTEAYASPLADVELATRLDTESWWTAPRKTLRAWRQSDRALRQRIRARLRMPRQALARIRSLVGPLQGKLVGVAGAAKSTLAFEGSLLRPSLAGRLQLFGLHARQGTPRGRPVDADVHANYFGGDWFGHAQVRRDGEAMARLQAHLRDDLTARFRGHRGPAGPADWSMHLNRAPLAVLPNLHRRGVAGRVSGTMRLRQPPSGKPSLSGRLALTDLRIADKPVWQRAWLEAGATKGANQVRIQVGAVAASGGRLTCTLDGSLRQGPMPLLPTYDANQPAQFKVEAERFSLAGLGRLSQGRIAALAGWLEGYAQLRYGPRSPKPVELKAQMRLREGRLNVAGQRIQGAQADLDHDGDQLRLKNLKAILNGGAVAGSGAVAFAGLRPTHVAAHVSVDAKRAVPVSVDGRHFGKLSGEFGLRYRPSRQDKGQSERFQLRVEQARLDLPPQRGRDVQSLAPHPDIQWRQAGEQAAPSKPASSSKREVEVVVRQMVIQGAGADLRFATPSGKPLRIVNGRTNGGIEVSEGRFRVLGKTFVLERASLDLAPARGAPPTVSLLARWDAPDGTRVYAEYLGPVDPIDPDRLKLRSLPERSPEAVASLLLLGEADDPATSVARGSGQERANNLGAAVVALRLNQALGRLAPRLSVGGSVEGNRSLRYQLNDRVSAVAAIDNPENQAGQAQGASEEATQTKLMLNWRVSPRWLVRGSLGLGGQAPSGVDLFYQYRY